MSAVEVRFSRSEIEAANREAFTDVFGDPFAKPEPIPGQYQLLKSRGIIAAMRNNSDEGKASRNAARPSMMDFFCDVENVITRNLSPRQYEKFVETYLYEVEGALSSEERVMIEQKIGRLLRGRRISPVARYFKTVRQPGLIGRKHGRG